MRDRKPGLLRGLTGLVLVIAVGTACGEEYEPLERILTTARDFLSATLTHTNGVETHIEIGRLDSRLRLARCAQPPSAQLAPGARTQGNTTVNVKCAEPVSWSIFVPVSIERHAQIVVAARALTRHQVIRPEDIRLEHQDTGQLSSGYFSDPSDIVGMEVKRRLMPGQILGTAHVAPRQLIERGQAVTLYAARPGLTVRMKGEALESGAEGQRIRVRNRSSKRIVEGHVEPSGAVRVAF